MVGSRAALAVILGVAVAACAKSPSSSPPQASVPSGFPRTTNLLTGPSPLSATATPSAPSPTPTARSTPRSSATAMPLKTGWPTVRRSGVTMTAKADVAPPPFEGCPAPAPALIVVITLTGLAPGEEVPLPGTATYDFGTLACGVQPSPCVWGSDTTDPAVQLCRPEYSEAAKGTVGATATATADAQGTATATLRFVIPEAVRVCPAGGSRPWYVESGQWTARVTDTAHGLRLVGPPDLIIGP